MSLSKRLNGQTLIPARPPQIGKPVTRGENGEPASKAHAILELKDRVLRETIEGFGEEIDLKQVAQGARAQFEAEVENTLNTILQDDALFMNRSERQRLVREVTDEIAGYGPIDLLLHDPDVSEIMVNGPRQVYVERKGKLHLTDIKFRDDDHVLHTIEKIILPLGRRIDEASPLVDARLPDGSRVNAIIPPLAINGPTITIRKFAADPFTVEDMINFGTLSTEISHFVRACVASRINIVVSGSTGSGKTTVLNILSGFIPEDERIITIEDAAELQLRQEHVVTLEARPPNLEGEGRIAIRDLVINSLRMRPDRIVIGEVRGGEALDMLQAMNTGHDGSLTTGHANSPRDMLTRLETMVLMAGVELPVRAVREQIASSIELVVHLSRFKDGTRKVTHVTEIVGLESDTITLQDIFIYEQTGLDEQGRVLGRHRPTGIVPRFLAKLEQSGNHIPADVFRFPYSTVSKKRLSQQGG
ncbi:MAG: CpaF family protein [Clostridia bacterium]|nr:CpaF family protein [Clostridia bacterium]